MLSDAIEEDKEYFIPLDKNWGVKFRELLLSAGILKTFDCCVLNETIKPKNETETKRKKI